MALISFDNGNTYLDPNEDYDEIAFAVNDKDEDGLTDQQREWWWEEIVNLMDDETREETHLSFEYDEGDNLGFLIAYLKRADHDLVIG